MVLAPPASGFRQQLEGLAEAAKARLVDFGAEVQKAGLGKKGRELLREDETAAVFDRLLPDVKAQDCHRILFGFPKTLAQVHYLRQHKVYPHKLFVVHEDRGLVLARIQERFAADLGLDAHTATVRARESLEEYEG